ncbi:MAG: hypothetical protein AAGC74_10040, partial [Verrucomicrobiota bacterium]
SDTFNEEVAIRIGSLDWDVSQNPKDTEISTTYRLQVEGGNTSQTTTYFPDDPGYTLEVFENELDESIFPLVIYRYQIPSTKFPVVSNQVVQVSPLIDRVRTAVDSNNPNSTSLYDPFVRLANIPGLPLETNTNFTKPIGLYARDTQGVIKGANYVYLLARFKENRELDRVFKVQQISIPE